MVEFPERNEILFAVVKKIMPYGAFCFLPEYNMDAFMHISQVSSGWVKNIHEFLSEGQRLVVKVHQVTPEKNQVDISLRSVTEDEKRKKSDEMRRTTRGKKLLELAMKNAKLKGETGQYETIIEENYDDVLACFEDCFENGVSSLKDLDLPKKLKDEIFSLAKANIKKSKIILNGTISLSCPSFDGIEKIKDVLDFEDESLTFTYLGAPKYRVSFVCDDYKKGEKELSKIISTLEKKSDKNNCSFSFKREES